jgi:anaerobic ribonucleoside-triphosphate reductase activating protein
MLEMCLRWSNVIIDGRFEKELRDITLPLRGSSNQRVIDARKTFRLGKVVECEEYLNSEV